MGFHLIAQLKSRMTLDQSKPNMTGKLIPQDKKWGLRETSPSPMELGQPRPVLP
jgi:hypothetical protein